jgi:hypothetical protein
MLRAVQVFGSAMQGIPKPKMHFMLITLDDVPITGTFLILEDLVLEFGLSLLINLLEGHDAMCCFFLG